MSDMKSHSKALRIKLSTTVARENFAHLAAMVKAGKASTMAEAVDLAIAGLRKAQNRSRLEQATAVYFDTLADGALRDERALSSTLQSFSEGIDFDREP